jgi:hypothetical protein
MSPPIWSDSALLTIRSSGFQLRSVWVAVLLASVERLWYAYAVLYGRARGEEGPATNIGVVGWVPALFEPAL